VLERRGAGYGGVSMPVVAAVVLGWNLRDETEACGRSLLEQGYDGLRLLFVDNGSTDGSPAFLRSRFPDAEVIELGENRGIAAGYNAGLERALAIGADYALILNNDTLFAPGMLSALVAAADAHPEAGVLMPKILYEADRGRIWSAGARRRVFPPGNVFIGLGRPDGPAFDQEREVEYAPSCALLIRRATLEQVGLFDPGYFFYYDDWDYCERVRLAGQTIRYVPGSAVYHKVSLSTARSSKPARWWYVMGRSAVLYYRRYYRPMAPSLALYAGWFVAREAASGNARYLPLFLRGLAHALTGRPMLAPDSPT
jgi:GT2 family glycosyltransferase